MGRCQVGTKIDCVVMVLEVALESKLKLALPKRAIGPIISLFSGPTYFA